MRRRSAIVFLCCVLSGPRAAADGGTAAQPAPRPSQDAPAAPVIDVDALPISLDRIVDELEKTPVLELSGRQPTFRVRIFGNRPRWLGDIDWLGVADGRRPPSGVPWNARYLDMVTPPEMRGVGAFGGMDLLQVIGTSLLEGLAVGVVSGKVTSTVRERRERQARQEVDAAIAAWKQEREEAAAKQQAAPVTQTTPP